jgi:hypothetical protein
MRAYALACSVILLSACSRVHDGADTGIPPSDATAAELRRLKEVEWPKAYREQDTVLLDRILHPDFEMVDAEGHVYRKQDEMEWIRTHTWSVDSFRYEIKRLQQWPNGTAIVSGVGHMLTDSSETTYWSSNVFIRTDGHWRAISSHVSGVNEVPRYPSP